MIEEDVQGLDMGQVEGIGLDGRIQALHVQLQSTIQNMETRMGQVLHKHEQQFVNVYRSNMNEIKRQMFVLKKRLEEQERRILEDQRVGVLEREVRLLGEESVKLYSIIQKKQGQLLEVRERLREANQNIKRLERENKGVKVQLRENRADLEEYEVVFEGLRRDRENDRKKVDAMVERESKNKVHREFMETIKGRSNSVHRQVSKMNTVREVVVNRSQLQEIFLDCVKTVKRQVKNRNIGRGLLRGEVSLQEFKNIDKLKVLLMLVENQKIIDWLYHKIFPDRYSELVMKLHGGKDRGRGRVGSDGSLRGCGVDMNVNEEELCLPEIKKNLGNGRNNVMMKDGKIVIHDYLYG